MDPFHNLVFQYLVDIGLFKDSQDDERNRQLYCNYRVWPLLNAIFSRVNGIWAPGPNVNCVATVGTLPSCFVYMENGEVQIRPDSFWGDSLFEQIRGYKNANIQFVYIAIGVVWNERTVTDNSSSHLGMIVVNTVDQTYSYFDPATGDFPILDELQPTKQRRVNIYDIFCCHKCKPLIPGYTCVDQRQLSVPSLQHTMDTTDPEVKPENPDAVVPFGLCAVITFLVMMCCFRFQSGNPWMIAECINHTFRRVSIAEKGEFRINVTAWFVSIYKANHWKTIAQLLGVCGDISRDTIIYNPRMCGVLDTSNTTYCDNAVCDGRIFCAQHYYNLVLQSLAPQEHFTCYITDNVMELNDDFPIINV
jgi:hypothetical protein